MPEYHTYQTLKTDLDGLRALDRRNLVDSSLTAIGRSPDRQWEIPAIKIGRNAGHRIFFMSGAHAREWVSVEVLYLLAELLIKIPNEIQVDSYYDRYKEQIKWLVQHREIWIVPMLNPEGASFSQKPGHESWRKNHRLLGYESYTTQADSTWAELYTRFGPNAASSDRGIENWEELARVNRERHGDLPNDPNTSLPVGIQLQIPVYGVDLNRNYPFQWGKKWDSNTHTLTDFSPDPNDGAYPGTHPASEYEARAVMKLINNAKSEGKPFQAVLTYHSSGEVILYPWGYKADETTQSQIIEFAYYMVDLINEVKEPSYNSERLRRNVRELRENNELNRWFRLSGRPYYFPINPGAMDFGAEGGSFLDWAYANSRGMPVYTIELGRKPSGATQADSSQIVPMFQENLPAALALIEYGSFLRRTKRFAVPDIRTEVTPERISTNTVYVCYLFPWGGSSNFSLAWMKDGQFVREVAWGDEVDLTLLVNDTSQVQQEMPVTFEVFESDIFRFSDDFLMRFNTTLQPNSERANVRWNVGEVGGGALEDAYSDTGRVEFQFRAEIGDDVLRSEEVNLIQEARLFWEVLTPFTGEFTLIARFRGMPVHLPFSGKFIISTAFGPNFDDYSTTKQFPFRSRQDQQRITRQEDTIEIRQAIRKSDLHISSEPENSIREYPFGVETSGGSHRAERVRLNLKNEPRYSFAVEISIGDETFEALQKDMLVRAFEDIFIEATARPNLNHHPVEDEVHEAAYRKRMVVIPDEVVTKLREEVIITNEDSNFKWWRRRNLSRSGGFMPEAVTITRTARSAEEAEQRLHAFVTLASSKAEISDLINRDFNVDEINRRLHLFRNAPTPVGRLTFFSSSSADTGILLNIVGIVSGNRREETITLNGTNRIPAANIYQSIQSIAIESGVIHEIIKAEIDDPTATQKPVFNINVNERKIRYDHMREMNEFLQDGGSVLTIDSTVPGDRDPFKSIIVLGYSDQQIRNQVTEEFHPEITGRTRFFKLTKIYLTGDFAGFISIRASRDNVSKTLWRNIFDEDIPESIVEDFRRLGHSLPITTGRWTHYLQKLANVFQQYLGLDKEIWVFLYDTLNLVGSTTLAETKKLNDYYLVTVRVNHLNYSAFSDPETGIPLIAHECKHAHQFDRSAKLPAGERTLSLNDLQTGHNTFDLRVAKAWKLNEGRGYFIGGTNYPLQIREIDSEEFKERVFGGLISRSDISNQVNVTSSPQ